MFLFINLRNDQFVIICYSVVYCPCIVKGAVSRRSDFFPQSIDQLIFTDFSDVCVLPFFFPAKIAQDSHHWIRFKISTLNVIQINCNNIALLLRNWIQKVSHCKYRVCRQLPGQRFFSFDPLIIKAGDPVSKGRLYFTKFRRFSVCDINLCGHCKVIHCLSKVHQFHGNIRDQHLHCSLTEKFTVLSSGIHKAAVGQQYSFSIFLNQSQPQSFIFKALRFFQCSCGFLITSRDTVSYGLFDLFLVDIRVYRFYIAALLLLFCLHSFKLRLIFSYQSACFFAEIDSYIWSSLAESPYSNSITLCFFICIRSAIK